MLVDNCSLCHPLKYLVILIDNIKQSWANKEFSSVPLINLIEKRITFWLNKSFSGTSGTS